MTSPTAEPCAYCGGSGVINERSSTTGEVVYTHVCFACNGVSCPLPVNSNHGPDACSIPFRHVGGCEVRGPGGWVEWPDVPHEPWTEVISGLYIGGALHKQPEVDDFDTVITLWRRAEPLDSAIEEYRVPFPDTDVPPTGMLRNLAGIIEQNRSWGFKTLVRCQLGLNRSALVAGFTMVYLYGMSPQETIEQIRGTRSPHALCNPNFERFLRDLHEAA